MFWSKDKKTDKQKKGTKDAQASGTGNNLSVGNSDRQRIQEEALANARKARVIIGEDTLDRIAAAMTRKQESTMEQAKAQIAQADSDRVIDEIMYMMDQRD